jgi:hypothetical protein
VAYPFHLARGKHSFRVRAVGLTGLRGPVAREAFRIAPETDPLHPHR